jgi:hypothetical protein
MSKKKLEDQLLVQTNKLFDKTDCKDISKKVMTIKKYNFDSKYYLNSN